MTGTAHATLTPLKVTGEQGPQHTPRVEEAGSPLEVQFNPTTLRISRNNNVDRGGATTRTQKVQHPAQEGSTLTFDLEFDTAEQGGAGGYVDVRQWTALVRQFVEPSAAAPADPPPPVRFVWGTLRYNGIVTQVNEELDHFAPDGTPLRAKVAVTIVEQNFAYQANALGPGARDAGAATEAGDQGAGAAPGTAGTSRPRQVVQAHGGESAQQLLSRVGLDPAAWRGAMSGLDSPLGLAAGAGVVLGAEAEAGLAATAGISLSAGYAGEAAATSTAGLAAALGITGGAAAGPAGGGAPAGTASAGPTAQGGPRVPGALPGTPGGPAGATPGSPDAAARAGFVLSAGGGIAAAAQTVTAAAVDLATVRARGSFEVPAARPAPPAGSGAAPPPGRLPPAGPDPRSTTYGRGIPLRARADPGTLAEVRAGGARSLADRARREEVPAPDPGAAPWERLPADPPGRAAADCEQRGRDAAPSTLGWTPRGGPP
ncbi:CIS tube protein [Streptomyces sp. HUAS TT3]|uniref:CIS tube protein n=1 Tax=Streptomyces sp. HUAS TT3 TaxID=3447510 RepID=UPI003F65D53B